MSNPIERLCRAVAADTSAFVPHGDGTDRAAVAVGRRGGAVVASLLVLAVVTTGGSAPPSVDVTGSMAASAVDAPVAFVRDDARTPVTGTPATAGAVAAGHAREAAGGLASHDVVGTRLSWSESPADARPASGRATSLEPTFERPAWLRQIPLGPAPYYSETLHPFAEYCRGVGWVEVSSTWTNFCQFTDLELPDTADGDFVAKLVVCKDPDLFGPSTLTFATDPEVDLLLWHLDKLALGEERELAYRWSKTQSYAVTPHTVDLYDKCVAHSWHLELADDNGQPLVSGDSYYIEWVMQAPELGEIRSQTRRFVAP